MRSKVVLHYPRAASLAMPCSASISRPRGPAAAHGIFLFHMISISVECVEFICFPASVLCYGDLDIIYCPPGLLLRLLRDSTTRAFRHAR
jgi:hypothetical protein